MLNQSVSSETKAYLAGFLDADGSIYVRLKPNRTYRYGYQVAPYIVFFQSSKSRQKFESLCARIGLGGMRIRKDGIMEYTIGRKESIETFLSCVGPYLFLKKEQAGILLEILRQKPLVKNECDFESLMKLVDSFRELNYSKKRKKRILTP